ncbi:hypothetical protein CHS0354_023776 [Potamilus streckersoni]|uniref:Transcriptional regulator MraZ n=1 Tax=Potamilus streckersoni TaxID=2493646 RepID=A0AAE0RYZ4_9BIVA|nr:hypothetical protein CHS0354_023776 [Potamilus streckersoni]
MSVFTGLENYSIDEKGRLMIPAKFRKELESEEGVVLYMMKMQDKSILLYQKKEWEEVEKELKVLSDFKKEERNLKMFFYSNSEKVELDRQGRIMIPKRFLEDCGITKDVRIVGAGNKLAFWSPQNLEASMTEISQMDNLVTGEGVYIDGTLGGAGHSEGILLRLKERKLLEGSVVYGFDKDEDAINYSVNRLAGYGDKFRAFHRGYEAIVGYPYETAFRINEVGASSVRAKGIVLDLGISSHQINEKQRGFSFLGDALLDMRFSKENPFTARDLVNSYSMDELVEVIKNYGEEPKFRAITKAIIKQRAKKEIRTTAELARMVDSFYGNPREKMKARARVFQAIRIEVNHELDALRCFLDSFEDVLEAKGRLAIISYHSLEDRLVKQRFKHVTTEDWGPKTLMNTEPLRVPTFQAITKKPIYPAAEEIKGNARSRSARLRIIEKI